MQVMKKKFLPLTLAATPFLLSACQPASSSSVAPSYEAITDKEKQTATLDYLKNSLTTLTSADKLGVSYSEQDLPKGTHDASLTVSSIDSTGAVSSTKTISADAEEGTLLFNNADAPTSIDLLAYAEVKRSYVYLTDEESGGGALYSPTIKSYLANNKTYLDLSSDATLLKGINSAVQTQYPGNDTWAMPEKSVTPVDSTVTGVAKYFLPLSTTLPEMVPYFMDQMTSLVEGGSGSATLYQFGKEDDYKLTLAMKDFSSFKAGMKAFTDNLRNKGDLVSRVIATDLWLYTYHLDQSLKEFSLSGDLYFSTSAFTKASTSLAFDTDPAKLASYVASDFPNSNSSTLLTGATFHGDFAPLTGDALIYAAPDYSAFSAIPEIKKNGSSGSSSSHS